MRSLFTLRIWLMLMFTACESRKIVEKQQNKKYKYSEIPTASKEDDNTLNICDLENNKDMNMNCFCDLPGVGNATNAKCWFFNKSEGEDWFVWDEFKSQWRLTSLTFNVRSNIDYIPTKALSLLPNLHEFSLLYANISRLVSFAFANLTELEKLDLKQNQISVLEKYSIAHLPSLTEINLAQNRIREIGRNIFVKLPSLKRLFIEENIINVIQDLSFSELKQLEELEMFKNEIVAISRNTFSGLTSLKRLDLHSNQLNELQDFTFAEMPNLRELIIEQNMIESIGEKVFYGIKHLDRLVLSENKLHILPDDVFASLPKLRVLDLRDNLLQTFSYDTAMPIMDKLKNNASFYFHIESNRLECDCNLSWLRLLANQTVSNELRSKLQSLSCYMKGNYFIGDETDQEINTKGLSDNRLLQDTLPEDNRNHEIIPDRMLKLFDIPPELLPCPEKRHANEVLMEKTSKTENINAAHKIFNSVEIFSGVFIIIIKAFIL